MVMTNIMEIIEILFEEVVGNIMGEIRMDWEASGGSGSNGDDDEVEDEVDVRWR